jgi:hypothetical protein
MRIVIISLQATADDAPDAALGGLTLGGRSIAERQLDFALALGAERVVCIADALDPRVLALQHRTEAAGAQFNLIAGARWLLGLVHANDEVVAIADGLLLAPDEAQKALAGGPGVLVLPVEAGLAAGFERIDLNHAWAGVLAMQGRLVEQLVQLPPDCDPISGLLRIALQGRAPKRVLPEAVLTDERWALIRTRHQLAELEPAWFRRHAAAPDWRAPGKAIARFAVRRLGGVLLERRVRPSLLAAAGLAFAASAVAVAGFGMAAAGFVLFAAGWLVAEGGSALAMLASAGAARERSRLAGLEGWLLDLALAAIVALALGGGWLERLFAPIVLLGLLRIAARRVAPRWAETFEDRAVLVLIIAFAFAFGALLPVAELLALAVLALLLGLLRGTAQLTQT